MTPRFVSHKVALAIHVDQINTFGGSHGLRDLSLFDSALAQPRMQFGGEYLHSTIYLMAAAYGFHLCKNHPFVDGNKRTAFVVMATFLKINGFDFSVNDENAYHVMIKVATSQMNKDALAFWLENVTYTS